MLAWWSTLLALAAAVTAAPDAAYRSEVEAWRVKREERLKADGGWLTVVGLHWLQEGENRFGTDAGNHVVLPAGSAPARAGTLTLAGGRVTLSLEPGVAATVGAAPVTGPRGLRSDVESEGQPDVLALGTLQMHVIDRGGRLGVRLKDMESPLRKAFTGLRWYPVQEAWRVTARYVTYAAPKMIKVPTVLGTMEEMPSPGYAVFERDGREVRIEGVRESPDAEQLFYIFHDETSGKETYPPGRFLYSELPKDGTVVLDFNRAYNPPCAFTPYATCPLPPPENWLKVPVRAGERDYGDHAGAASPKSP
jgi:uncharacterized protein (DUF1684 family)